jgi:hypothetical protein
MSRKSPQIQKRGVPLIEKMLRWSAALTKEEQIFLAKHLAIQCGDPLYTQSEMESKLQLMEAEIERRKRVAEQTQENMSEYTRLLREAARSVR